MPHLPESIVYSVNEAIKVSTLKRTRLYELLNSGAIKSIKVGKRRLIDAASLHALLTGDA